MSSLALMFAVLLPWAAGALSWQMLLPRDVVAGRPAIVLGAGYVIGFAGWGVLLRWVGAGVDVGGLFARGAAVLALLVAGLAAWWFVRARRDRAVLPVATREHRVSPTLLALAALLFVFAIMIVLQATALPSLAWDAWNAWFAKAKGWYFAGSMVATVSPNAWLTATSDAGIAVIAPEYPATLPRLVLWLASAHGAWDESVSHLLWPGLWFALALALYGYQRAGGIARLQAALLTSFIATLPLVVAHATLAGYADLWVAATLLIAVAQSVRWLQSRQWRDAALALVAAALLPALKQEGAIWLACLAAAVVLGVLPRRWRWIGFAAALFVLVVSLPFGGLSLPLPGLGWVKLGWGIAVVPGVGTMQLFWRPVTGAVVDGLLLRQNWSLLWYLTPCVLWLARGAFARQPPLGALGWFFSLGFAFLALLFFFTDASQWAENLTSLNRVLLQIVPAFVLWLSLLWVARRAASDTPHRSDR